MKNLVIAQRNRDLNVFEFLGEEYCGAGKYRVITKCRAGFMVTSVVEVEGAIQHSVVSNLKRFKVLPVLRVNMSLLFLLVRVRKYGLPRKC